MEKKLNIKNIKNQTEKLGLNNNDIGKNLGVSRQIVSSWFKNEKFPRPKYLLKLAKLLNLSFNDIKQEILTGNEPVICFRKRGASKIKDTHFKQIEQIAPLLNNLVKYLPYETLEKPATLIKPENEYNYIQKITEKLRKKLNIKKSFNFEDIISVFKESHAVLIPVLWGKKNRHENAVHIYLPKSMTTWIFINLDTYVLDFKFWLAHELGHVKAIDLNNDIELSENFADNFAGALLFPEKYAEKAYSNLVNERYISNKLKLIKELSHEYLVSPITIYYEINKFAKNYGKKLLNFEKKIYPVAAQANKKYGLINELISKTNKIKASDYIKEFEDFESPFIECLKKYLKEENKSEGFISNILQIPMLDAKELYNEIIGNS